MTDRIEDRANAREAQGDVVTREYLLEALRDQRIQLGGMHDKTLTELKRVREDAGEYMRKQEDEIKQLRAALSAPVPPPDGAPDYETAARALGFLRMEKTGNWIHPNYSDGLMRRYKSAEEIFNREVPDLFRPSDDVRSALAIEAISLADRTALGADLGPRGFEIRKRTMEILQEFAAALRSAPVSAPAVEIGEPREPTPHWDRRWPHDQPNGWNLDAAKFLSLVQTQQWLWHFCGRAKYIELRIDTRDGAFNLYDRDKKPLNPDDVVAAVEKAKQEYAEAAIPAPDAAGQ